MTRVFLTGGSGFLGAYLARRLAGAGELFVAFRSCRFAGNLPANGVGLDFQKQDWVERLARLRPHQVIHAAALTDADRCQREPEAARQVNRLGTRRLAEAVAETCERFIYCSTDLVFSGRKSFYRESDAAEPLMAYGESKLEGEREARAVLGARAVVVRLALLYGASPSERQSFSQHLVREALAGRPVRLFSDQFRTPLFLEDAARGLELLLTAKDPPACVHLAGPERVSRYDMGLTAARVFGFDPSLAVPTRMSEAPGLAPRPADVSLDISVARTLGFAPRGVAEGLEAMRDTARASY